MKIIALLTAIALCSACATRLQENPDWTYGLHEHNYGVFADRLRSLLVKIESGDSQAWDKFLSYIDSNGLDGAKAETYSIACAELVRRDPTIFLRHYMKGEEKALICGEIAYGRIGGRGRSLLDDVYTSRLYLADDASEQRKIRIFISTTKKK